MLPQEAEWIHAILYEHLGAEAFPLLNVGSQTAWFRTVAQPHIDALIFAPARAGGWDVIHTDMQQGEGVDIAGDLCDPAFRATLRQSGARSILCSNLLEHLPGDARTAVCGALVNILPEGGYLLVTVPSSYPYHPDPIDTGLRPRPEDLASFFPGTRTVVCEEISGKTKWQEFRSRPRSLGASLVRCLLPFYRPRNWLGVVHQFGWLFRPVRIACALLCKEA